MRLRALSGLLFGLACAAAADPVKAWVELRDKGALSPTGGRAYEDAPVHAPYLERLEEAGLRVSTALKWQNKVSGWADSAALARIAALPFVRGVERMPRKAPVPALPAPGLRKSASGDLGRYGLLFDTLGATPLLRLVDSLGQAPGQGVRVAVIDAGFFLGQMAFDSMFVAGRIADQWDFVRDTAVAAHDSLLEGFLHPDTHGQAVLSPLAADGGGFAGLVPRATYQLYRAEDSESETYVEEDFVAAAIERATDSGAHVVNISLGYRYDFSDGSPDYPHAMMDGRTRPASLAALGAARRNVLVVVAMGNSGPANDSGPTLSSPADADSILGVGILDFRTRRPCDYSSGGPTADGRAKPDVASLGADPEYFCSVPVVPPWTYDPEGSGYNPSGTSLAAPFITGVAALLKQLHPAAGAQQIRAALMATAGQALAPDSGAGHGAARAWRAHLYLSNGGGVALRPVARAPSPPANARVLRPRDIRGRTGPSKTGPVIRPAE